MISHLLSHPIGLIHLLFSSLALIAGAVVLLLKKGNRLHKMTGRTYFFSMLALNGTALMDYELFGGFGPFHWMALASLATVVAGVVAARNRNPYWRERHAYFMTWSYVGLVAAAVAEVGSRLPGWSFATAVITSSVVTVVVGIMLMNRYLPVALGQTRQ